jgi:hypothetical protein
MVSQEIKDFRKDTKLIPIKPTPETPSLWISSSGLEIGRLPFSEKGNRIPWSSIKEISVDGADTMESRVTATRILAIGIFALAAKKKTGECYLTVSCVNGEEFYFVVPKMTAPKLRTVFKPYEKKLSK